MPGLYFLSLRDVNSDGIGVTSAEIYELPDIQPATSWPALSRSDLKWVSWEDVKYVFHGKRVCFIVHGFNVNVDHGMKAGGPMAQEFENEGIFSALDISSADIVVTVLWPGDGFIVTSWFSAVTNTRDAGRKFSDLLISSAFGATSVSFVTHSLGARLVLETIMRTVDRVGAFPIEDAIFTAAAIADKTLDDERYASAVAALKRIIILSSPKDDVLSSWFVAGDQIENFLWGNYRGNGRAMGLQGPRFRENSKARKKTFWYEINARQKHLHGDYMPHGWERNTVPQNGWSEKREGVATFVENILDDVPLSVSIPWIENKTGKLSP